MVRGRRIKTCNVESEIQCFNVKVKAESLRKCRKKIIVPGNEHCITNYFKIEVAKDELLDLKFTKRRSPIDYNDYKKEAKDLFSIDDHLRTNVPSSPHRIELHPQVLTEVKPKKFELNQKTIKKTLNQANNKTAADHKLTEYFPVRRSIRKTTQVVLEEKQKHLEKLLNECTEDGLEIRNFEGKGRGVVTTRFFNKGDFVVEYSGELLDYAQAKAREARYAQDSSAGCYMYYFKHQDQQFCIDATPESGRLGRLVNHSRNGNLVTKSICVDGLPRLVLIAKEDIKVGEEISYDYGDHSKEALRNYPWLAF